MADVMPSVGDLISMNRYEIDRRSFLLSAMTASAFVLGEGGLKSRGFAAGRGPQHRLYPVRVSRERLVRTVVGLRPYRSEGFVVRAERLGGDV
jgi:hypothetical protein